MRRYVPSDTPTDIKTSAYIRQNCFKKNRDLFSPVRKSKTIHCPWAHTKNDLDEYTENPNKFLTKKSKGSSYVQVFASLQIGSPVLIPNGNNGLIVQITSDIKKDIMPSLLIAVKARTCGHTFVSGKHRCDECDESIQEVFDSSDAQKLSTYQRNGCLIEPFWSLYRDIEVIGEADYNGVDGRSMAGQNSAGKRAHYWKLQN